MTLCGGGAKQTGQLGDKLGNNSRRVGGGYAIGLVKPAHADFATAKRWNFRTVGLHWFVLRGSLEAHVFPGAYKIRRGAVPDRGRGPGHTAPTYFS